MTTESPLTPADCDLRGMPYMPLFGDRLFGSATWIAASPEAKVAALRLWWRSFAHEVPAGSLPNDDQLLADYAGYGVAVKAWQKIKTQAMRGWVLCSDGRLYHRTVAEVALEAWEQRKRNREKQARWRNKDRSVTPRVTVTEGVTEPFRNAGSEVKVSEVNKEQPNGCSPGEGGKAKRKSRLPDDFEATPERLEYAKANGSADPADTFARFKLHHQSKGTLAVDWDKAWQYWCRNETNFRRAQPQKHTSDSLPTSRDGDVQWSARLRGWRPGRFWNRGDWGPDPTEPGCRAPAAVLSNWRSEAMQ